MLRWVSCRPLAFEWSFYLHAHAKPLDHMCKNYAPCALIPKPKERNDARTSVANYCKLRGMPLNASYPIQVVCHSFVGDVKTWARHVLSSWKHVMPCWAKYVRERLRFVCIRGRSFNVELVSIQQIVKTFLISHLDSIAGQSWSCVLDGMDMVRILFNSKLEVALETRCNCSPA